MAEKVKITFLGTAGQMPSARRNHTSMLLNYREESILIDCGEGTQRQFRKARLNPCKVTRILITHWHGDHVFGLPGFLSTLALSGYNKTLKIYGPRGTKEFIKDLLKIFKFTKNYDIEVHDVSGKFFETENFYLEAEKMEHGIPTNAYCFVEKGKLRIDKAKLKKLKIEPGIHLKDLKLGKDIVYEKRKYQAKDLTYNERNKKISFILDTKDNSRIGKFVKDSNLLICESSFGEELSDKADEHLHLTADQAAKIAKNAKVDSLILTHIGGRYEADVKSLEKDAKKIFRNSKVVNDFDVVELK